MLNSHTLNYHLVKYRASFNKINKTNINEDSQEISLSIFTE